MEDVPRPIAVPTVVDRARDWLNWFGVVRLVTSAIATIVVCAGGWWLVRTPAPPTEASLPVASTGVSVAVAETLPVPTPNDEPVDATTVDHTVVVHVAGAVLHPGVYALSADSRVEAAIAAAGGPNAAAELDVLNLAALVVDGSRIYVPEPGEALPPVTPAPVGEAAVPAGPIDVNRATAGQLESLPGVGPATASAIVTERERNGPFVSVEDLERVPGIGPVKLAGFVDGVVT